MAKLFPFEVSAIRSSLFLCLMIGLILGLSSAPLQAGARKKSYPDSIVAEGFFRTVFGSEIKALSWGSQTNRVKKYVTPVRVWIDNRASLNRVKMVRKFVRSLPNYIPALKVSLTKHRNKANFRIFIVDSRDYASTVQNEIFRDTSIQVPGQCLVRVLSRRSGILGSDAVLVSDQGLSLFRRCMVEEILQGLGPLNDDDSLKYSVFNDRTNYDYFTHYDRLILNMLYNRRVKPGMTLRQVEPMTMDLLKDAKRIVSRR
ncbi:MAG: DUF2927 domain-containing protein [Cohaesibacter sp.]|jgi:hypothetical protein|nr:DUF2927 domain-containing protein [Cohaesibacter sp.]